MKGPVSISYTNATMMRLQNRNVGSMSSMSSMDSSIIAKTSGLKSHANTTEIIPAPIVVPPSEYL
jgi:hypothetical protein